MTKLWILLAVSLVMAWIIDNRDKDLLHRGLKKQEHLVTWMLIIVLGFFCGLRTKGNDTTTYLTMYENIPVWDEYWDGQMYDIAGGVGFGALTSLLKTLGASPQNFLMFYAFVTTVLFVGFVHRYSRTMVFGVFLLFTTGFYTFSLAAIKQCMATGICLVAVNHAIDRKWIRYLLTMLLAMLFHPYAAVYLLAPFLVFKPWSHMTFIYMAVFVALGFLLDSLLGTVVDVTTMMGANYTEEEFLGEGVNIFRVLVSFIPIAFALLYGKDLFRNSTKTENLIFNMAMMNALIMFVGMFGTANYFARMANYFLPAQIIVLPWILAKTHPKDRTWLKACCVAGYLGYFVYENAVVRPFEYYYQHMSFWEYISTWF